jgi:multiple sugar transport system permease protein
MSLRNYLYVLPVFVYVFAMTIFPAAYTLYYSFTAMDLSRPQYGAAFVGLLNYVQLLSDPIFQQSLFNTVFFTFLDISIELVVGYLLASLLARDVKGISVFRTAALVPLMIPSVVVGFTWLYIARPFGLAQYIVTGIGLPTPDFFGNPSGALYTLIGINIWQWTPFVVIILAAGMQGLPVSALEAADLDGASWWRKQRQISLPMLSGILAVVILFRFVDDFRIFDTIYVTTSGGPGTVTYSISLYGYQEAFKFFEIGYASALSWMINILVLVMATILFWAILRAARG